MKKFLQNVLGMSRASTPSVLSTPPRLDQDISDWITSPPIGNTVVISPADLSNISNNFVSKISKRALITGISGQDGSFLAEQLLEKGYEVHGLVRRVSSGYENLRNIIRLVRDENIYRKTLFLHSGDLGDATSIYRIISDVSPHEIYNLAAQADVQESFQMPEYSVDINGTAVLRILEAIRLIDKGIRFYQASTSELFGKVSETPQR